MVSILQDEGVQFQLGKEIYTFRGTLTLVVGDNLGSQYIGGFKQLASALRKCRYCMAVAEDMSQKVSKAKLVFMRTDMYVYT